MSEAHVSINRIQKFLDFPELPDVSSRENQKTGGDASEQSESIIISLQHVSCIWNEVEEIGQHTNQLENVEVTGIPALTDVTMDLKRGQLTCLVGAVGSGKSALLQLLVGELPIKAGVVERRYGSLSYAAQDPWIMGGTVRENITMGLEFDAEWYEQVVNSCGLDVDFLQLRDGDETIVGDRGVQVSGGQRARIGLARALYKDADVLVADDPLSAVDAKVGRQLFQEAIMGLAVNRGKCVVVATHQHQHISEQRCALISNGTVACIGTYEECVAGSNGKLLAHAKDDSIDNLEDGKHRSKGAKAQKNDASKKPVDTIDAVNEKGDEGEEINRKGTVQVDTYLKYIRSMGGLWVAVFFMILFSITQATVLVAIATVGRWAERPAEEQVRALQSNPSCTTSLYPFIIVELKVLSCSEILGYSWAGDWSCDCSCCFGNFPSHVKSRTYREGLSAPS